jgi:hypothetical protein
MRGSDERTGSLFSYVDLEDRVPARERITLTRQRLSLTAVGFRFGDFIPPKIAMAARDCESGGVSHRCGRPPG